MLAVNHLIGFGAASAAPAVVSHSYRGATFTNSPASSYTFNSQDIGTAAADRKVVVVVEAYGTTLAVSSLTIGGNNASLVKAQVSASGGVTSEIWQLAVPSGTTANIVVNFSGTPDRCGIGVFAVYGAASAAYATAGKTGSPYNVTIDCPANGLIIGGAVEQNTGPFTWAGITERYDAQMTGGGFTYHTYASAEFATAQTALTVSSTPSSNINHSMAVASWGPA